jgi:hypothetical protein
MADALKAQRNECRKNGDYAGIVEIGLQQVKEAKDQNDDLEVACLLLEIGKVYGETLKDPKRAVECFLEGKETAERHDYDHLVIRALEGLMKYDAGDFPYHRELINRQRANGRATVVARTQLMLAEHLIAARNFGAAEPLLHEARDVYANDSLLKYSVGKIDELLAQCRNG